MPFDHSPAGYAGSAATFVSNSVAGAASQITPTLTATAAQTAWVQGFTVTGLGATALANVQITLAGILGGTMTFDFQFPAGVTAICTPLIVNFTQPIPASAVNTNIVLTVPTAGAGNTSVHGSIWGFLL